MSEQQLEQEDAEEAGAEKESEYGGDTKIKEVKCKGFKSFQRSTSVPFYEGLTAIVGENGSGKSNVVDALSFVFGKRSSSLRAEKLTQLIFDGGENRSKADYAQVTVTLDNFFCLFFII